MCDVTNCLNRDRFVIGFVCLFVAGSEPPGLSHQRTQSLPLANPAPISDQIISQPLRSSNVKRFKQSLKCMYHCVNACTNCWGREF